MGRGRQCAPLFLFPGTAPAQGGARSASLRLRGGKPCGRRWLPESKFLSVRRDPRGSVTAVVLEETARGHSGLRGPAGGVSVGRASLPSPVSLSDHSSFPESCLSS